MKRIALMALLAVTLLSPQLSAADDSFPLREKYDEVKWMSTEELRARLGKVIVVDARNSMEYEVIHITGAQNFLVGKMKKGDLLQLREQTGTTPFVFYCNGHTCSKSY